MRKLRFTLLAPILVLFALPTFATYCQDGNTMQMSDCLAETYEIADRELMRAYKNAMAFMGERRHHLRYAQRAWIDFRDKECNAQREIYAGGTLSGVRTIRCMIDLTHHRTAELWENYRP